MEFFNQKIRNYIASNLDLDNQFKFEKFKVGRSNITFKIFDDRNSYVLRRPPFGDKLESAHNMQREYRIINELSKNNIKVPKPILLYTDRTLSDDDFYIMEYIECKNHHQKVFYRYIKELVLELLYYFHSVH